MIEKVNGLLLFPKWFHFFTFDLGKKLVDAKIRTPALNRKTNNGLMNKQQQQWTTGPSKSDVLKSCVTSVVVLCPGGGGGGGPPIIFSWGCAAGTLRTLTYTRPC